MSRQPPGRKKEFCTACGSTRINDWDACMDCRNARGKVRTGRIKANGGSHTRKQWLALLAAHPACVICSRRWEDVPPRPDKRYGDRTWTKGHIVDVEDGGTNDIGNIQPECYECNFRKRRSRLARIACA